MLFPKMEDNPELTEVVNGVVRTHTSGIKWDRELENQSEAEEKAPI